MNNWEKEFDLLFPLSAFPAMQELTQRRKDFFKGALAQERQKTLEEVEYEASKLQEQQDGVETEFYLEALLSRIQQLKDNT